MKSVMLLLLLMFACSKEEVNMSDRPTCGVPENKELTVCFQSLGMRLQANQTNNWGDMIETAEYQADQVMGTGDDCDGNRSEDSWNLRQIKLVEAEVANPSNWACVYMPGTGVDWNHPEFAGTNRIAIDLGVTIMETTQYNASSPLAAGMDDSGQGTASAGIIVAANDGVAPRGIATEAMLVPIKVLDRNGRGAATDIATGILYAACQCQQANAPCVMVLPFVGNARNKEVRDAMSIAAGFGMLIFAGAGNTGDGDGTTDDGLIYPAADENVIAVAANDRKKLIADSSTSNRSITLAAPGENLGVLGLNGGYTCSSGTSLAAAHATGVGAAVMSELWGRSVRGSLLSRCATLAMRDSTEDIDDLGYDMASGFGLVNMAGAISTARTMRCE